MNKFVERVQLVFTIMVVALILLSGVACSPTGTAGFATPDGKVCAIHDYMNNMDPRCNKAMRDAGGAQ